MKPPKSASDSRISPKRANPSRQENVYVETSGDRTGGHSPRPPAASPGRAQTSWTATARRCHAAGRERALPSDAPGRAVTLGAMPARRPLASKLPDVRAFFTGPGDPRPILRALDTKLHELGQPPRDSGAWRQVTRARGQELAVIDDQDRATLTRNVPAFVRSVRHSAANFRQIAISATVFGSTRCVLRPAAEVRDDELSA